jgi:hypothetical protein
MAEEPWWSGRFRSDPPASTRRRLSVSYEQPDAVRQEIERAVDAGFEHIVFGLPSPWRPDVVHWVTDELINPSM